MAVLICLFVLVGILLVYSFARSILVLLFAANTATKTCREGPRVLRPFVSGWSPGESRGDWNIFYYINFSELQDFSYCENMISSRVKINVDVFACKDINNVIYATKFTKFVELLNEPN